MSDILEQIKQANDIKNIDPSRYDELAAQLRDFIIHSVSETGGHLASNLGVVELTMALHLCLDLPKDKIIWDVGHQSYTHKILTGRKDEFPGMRSYGGMSGFPKHRESQCDAFDTGHSSTSISAALGYVGARELTGGDYTVVAVIGDGSMTGGMVYEALNNAARLKSNLIIILNDNKMSISENVGGMSNYLNRIRTNENYVEFKTDVETALKRIPGIGESVARSVKKSKDSLKHWLIPGGFFEDLGIEYMGPVDGHDMNQLIRAIRTAKKEKQAVILHVITQKGRGYEPAEDNPSAFHGVGKFDIQSGTIEKSPDISYTEAFSKAIQYLGTKDERVVAVSAAMPSGTGLTKFAKRFPKRFFDVGIAEEHAVTFAGGLAAGGLKPYVAIYSSFFQRAYDQIVHDVCIPDLPVVFCVDRAGIVGADGETHQGVFDLSFLRHIPNMAVLSPKNGWELEAMLDYAVNVCKGPVAVRYPRGTASENFEMQRLPVEYGKAEWIAKGEDIAILAEGHMLDAAYGAVERLRAEGKNPSLVNIRFIRPLDGEILRAVAENCSHIFTVEDNVRDGGFGSAVLEFYSDNDIAANVKNLAFPDEYIEQGTQAQLFAKYGLDAEGIYQSIKKTLGE